MTTRIDIKAGEHGAVRVFATDLTRDQIRGFDVAAALGADKLDDGQVELFDLSDLQGVGLKGYLEEGYGIPHDQLADMLPQLEALTDVVLLVPSRAFGNQAQVLTPRPPLHFVATFFEEQPPVSFEKLPSDAAQGNVNTGGKPAPSNAAISGRVAMFVLLLLAGLVAALIWIAG